jgi:CHAT domain-containing protein
LLVSHRAVDSDATVRLIPKTLSTMAADKTIGRSEALLRSMVVLIEQGKPHEAHPAYWAPSVVVGESHWEVDSDATVKLIISAVGATTRDKSVGRAEALRRAMLAQIDKGEPHEAHPANWAPFVVVSEGAAAR